MSALGGVTIGRHRYDSGLVGRTRVGVRFEVDVFEDGGREVSRFPGGVDIVEDGALVRRLIESNRA